MSNTSSRLLFPSYAYLIMHCEFVTVVQIHFFFKKNIFLPPNMLTSSFWDGVDTHDYLYIYKYWFTLLVWCIGSTLLLCFTFIFSPSGDHFLSYICQCMSCMMYVWMSGLWMYVYVCMFVMYVCTEGMSCMNVWIRNIWICRRHLRRYTVAVRH